MHMRRYFAVASLFVAALCAAKAQAATNLVQNGSFETGNFADWTVTNNPQYSLVADFVTKYFGPESGTYYAMLGSIGSDSYLSQTLATSIGTNYTLSFYLASDGGKPSNFSVAVGSDMLMNENNLPASSYTNYVYDFTATSTATVLKFGSMDDPGYLLLDNISVVDPPVTGAPLPGSLWLASAPIGLILGARLLRRKSSLA